MLYRRFVLARDPPFDVASAITEIRDLSGWGMSDLSFILSVPRTTIYSWLEGARPGDDDGQAIRKLLAYCRLNVTRDDEVVA